MPQVQTPETILSSSASPLPSKVKAGTLSHISHSVPLNPIA